MTEEVLRSYRESNLELLESFERYLVARGMASTTVHDYKNSALRLVEQFGGRSIVEAGHADIREQMREGLARGLAAATINRQTFGLRMFFKFLSLAGIIQGNPMRAISYRKVPRRCPRVLSISEIEEIIAAAENPAEEAVSEALYATGVRVSEFCQIKLENVIFPSPPEHLGQILVRKGKGGKDRWVLFGRKANEAIKAYLAWRPSKCGYLFEAPSGNGKAEHSETAPLIFARAKHWHVTFRARGGRRHTICVGSVADLPTEEDARDAFHRIVATIPGCRIANGRTGVSRATVHREQRPYTGRAIHLMVNRLGMRAGIRGVHPHAFRRAFATHMLANRGDLRAIQELLGHANLSATMHYTHLTDHELRSIQERFHPHGEQQSTEND